MSAVDRYIAPRSPGSRAVPAYEPNGGLTTELMGALEGAVPVATLVFVLSSMLAMGLGLKVAQITAPLRNLRLVAMSLLANFAVMPLGAIVLARVLRLDEPLGVGLLLLGVAAGAPFLPKLAQIAKGNLAFAVALMVLLMVITVGYLPLVLPILLPGVSVNPVKIARSLVLLMLLPLAGALAVNAKLPAAAARAKPLFDRLSSLGLVLVVLLLVVVNFNDVLSLFGTRAILAGLLFIALGYVGEQSLIPSAGPQLDVRNNGHSNTLTCAGQRIYARPLGLLSPHKLEPNDQIRDQVQSYLDANWWVRDELQRIRQPSVDFRQRCGVPATP